MKSALSKILVSVSIFVATFLLSRNVDWYSFLKPQCPSRGSEITRSDDNLQELSIDGQSILDQSQLEVIANRKVTLAGKVRLKSTNYRWRHMKVKSGAGNRFPVDIPLLAIRIQISRLSSFGEKILWTKHVTMLEHKNGIIEWNSVVEIPNRQGEYRFSIDEVEYNEVFSYSKPLNERELFSVRSVVRD